MGLPHNQRKGGDHRPIGFKGEPALQPAFSTAGEDYAYSSLPPGLFPRMPSHSPELLSPASPLPGIPEKGQLGTALGQPYPLPVRADGEGDPAHGTTLSLLKAEAAAQVSSLNPQTASPPNHFLSFHGTYPPGKFNLECGEVLV